MDEASSPGRRKFSLTPSTPSSPKFPLDPHMDEASSPDIRGRRKFSLTPSTRRNSLPSRSGDAMKLDVAWSASAVSTVLPKKPYSRRMTVATSLALLTVLCAFIAAICTWSVMFNINSQGFLALSREIQVLQMDSIGAEVQQFIVQRLAECTAFAESARLGNTDIRVPTRIYLIAWPTARQLKSALYVGFPNGDLVGFGSLRGINNSILPASRAQFGTITFYEPTFQGLPTNVSLSSLPYNATIRPWYKMCSSTRTTALTPAYKFASGPVGVTACVPLFDDSRVAAYFGPAIPHHWPSVPILPSRSSSPLRAVVGIDFGLEELSMFLRTSLHTMGSLNSVIGWIFSTDATPIVIASSTSSVPVVMGEDLVPVTSVTYPVFNQTMQFIYSHANRSFVNEYLSIDGSQWIVSTRFIGTVSMYLVVVTPYSNYFAKSDYSNTVALLLIFLVIVPVCAVTGAVVAWLIYSRPTKILASSMDRITNQLDFDVSGMGQDYSNLAEIATMQQSYLSMQSALISFTKFAPIPIVKKLLQQKKAAELGVEATVATCFFSDIENFTSLAESVTPDVLISVMREYFNFASAAIETREGVVGDYVGDAVVGFWNAPTTVSRHAALACSSAVAQQEGLAEMRKEWKLRGLPELYIRIGIHSGPVLAGNVGSDTRLKYTLIGDAVNLASRLEGLGKLYKCNIIISSVTLDEPGVREGFVARCLDVVTVVGKRLATRVFAILCKRSRATTEVLWVEKQSVAMVDEYIAGNFVSCLSMLHAMQLHGFDDRATAVMIERVNKLIASGDVEFHGASQIHEK